MQRPSRARKPTPPRAVKRTDKSTPVPGEESASRRRSKRRRGVGDRAIDPADSRTGRLQIRVEPRELDAWGAARAREGYLSISDWCRDRLNSAARSSVHGSSVDQTWNTPPEVIDPIVAAFGAITLDPCSNDRSIVPARLAWTLERDGDSLVRIWPARGRIYVNPPYKRALPDWIRKVSEVYAARRGQLEIIMLVPARTDSRWWHAAIDGGALVGFWRGRIRFLGARGSRYGALFPSALLYWGERPERFQRIKQIRVTGGSAT